MSELYRVKTSYFMDDHFGPFKYWLLRLLSPITGRMPLYVREAYTPEGGYIGGVERAKHLCDELGIAPEAVVHNGKRRHVCSFGKSVKDGKWYGWSHRAIYGFRVGDVVKEGDLTNSSGYVPGYLAEHPEDDLSLPVGFEAKTEEDARRMAIAFAEAVS